VKYKHEILKIHSRGGHCVVKGPDPVVQPGERYMNAVVKAGPSAYVATVRNPAV